MRAVVVAIVAALAVNAALIVWLAPLVQRDPDPVPEPPTETGGSDDDTVVAVVLFDEPAAARQPPPAPVTTDAKPPVVHAPALHTSTIASTRAVASSGGAPTTSDAPPDAPVAPVARGSLGMRRVDLSPARVAGRVAAAASDATGRTTTAGTGGELRPSGRGTYTTDLGGSGWQTRTATARVARDGTVTFENAPDFDIHLAGLGLAGKFNADDWLARKAGIDPYASAKLAYLDRTRDERARIAEVNRADDLAHAQPALRHNLDAARAIPDPAARKQALFELWDDVAETGDEALVRAGAGARAYLVGAIRAMRPALEFTADELAQLNAHRRSRAVFAPYE